LRAALIKASWRNRSDTAKHSVVCSPDTTAKAACTGPDSREKDKGTENFIMIWWLFYLFFARKEQKQV
jgi:hypothetical protein